MEIAIAFFSFIGVLGLVIFILNVRDSVYYLEAQAEIIGFEKSYSGGKNHKVVTGYMPLLKFSVNGKEYSGRPAHSAVWTKPDTTRRVVVRYNPQNPNEFSHKSNGMAIGLFWMLFAAGGILAALNWG